jgi:PAS domain S-box-containing protein
MGDVPGQDVSSAISRALGAGGGIFYKVNMRTGEYYHISPSAGEALQSSPEQIIREDLVRKRDRIHPDDLGLVNGISGRLLEQGSGTARFEARVRRNDGSYIWLENTVEVLRDETGEPCVFLGYAREITARKVEARHNREVQSRFEKLWKHAKIAIAQTRLDGQGILSCNERLAHMFGYENAEECVREFVPIKAYVNPSQRAGWVAQLKHQEELENVEAEIRRKDGIVVWLRFWMLRRPDGETCDIVGEDITVKKLLTVTEMEVLRYLMTGMNNKEIAVKLSRSLRTVENHRASIMNKLGVKTSIALAKRVADCDLG